jgi:tetratricopeptide (TPR) repeat protein
MRRPLLLALTALALPATTVHAEPPAVRTPTPARSDDTTERQVRAKRLVERARSQLERNLVDLAIDTYARALEEYPAYPLVHNEIGSIYTKQGDLARARASFEKAVALDPGFAVAWSNLGEVLRRLKLKEDAIAAFGKAIAADPKDAPSYYALAALWKAQKKDAEALWAIEQYLKSAADPQSKQVKQAQSVAAHLVGQGIKPLGPAGTPPLETPLEPVVAAVEPGEDGALTLEPGEPGSLASHAGDIEFAERHYLEALEKYHGLLGKHPDDLTLLYKLGATHGVLGQYREAIRVWRRAALLAPAREIFRQQIGLAAIQLHKRGHLRLEVPSQDASIEAGRKALLAGQPAQALEALRGLEDPEAGYLRGEALLRLGLYMEARDELQALLTKNPGDVDALGGVAESLLRLGGGEEAEQALQAWLGDRSLLAEDFLVLRAEEAGTRIAFGPEVGDEFE